MWGYTMARGDRSVDVFVRKVRQKLESVSPRWRYLHTHFGVGYRFAPEAAEEGTPAPGASDPAAGLMAANLRNVAIVLALAALVALIPGGGTGANVAIQAVSLAFLASIAWVAMVDVPRAPDHPVLAGRHASRRPLRRRRRWW